eukprot:2858957-Prymnesium_polylepis.1
MVHLSTPQAPPTTHKDILFVIREVTGHEYFETTVTRLTQQRRRSDRRPGRLRTTPRSSPSARPNNRPALS